MEYELNLHRMLCPLPVIRTQDKIGEMSVGDMLRVKFTDPGALSDIPAWCRINGHEIIEIVGTEEIRKDLEILIRVSDQNQ